MTAFLELKQIERCAEGLRIHARKLYEELPEGRTKDVVERVSICLNASVENLREEAEVIRRHEAY